MHKPTLIIALTAATVLAAGAADAHPGGRLFAIAAPQLSADGLSVHGTVCRTGAHRFAASPVVSVEQTGANGRTTLTRAALYGDVRPSGPGCFQYRAALASAHGAIRVCAARRLDANDKTCVTP